MSIVYLPQFDITDARPGGPKIWQIKLTLFSLSPWGRRKVWKSVGTIMNLKEKVSLLFLLRNYELKDLLSSNIFKDEKNQTNLSYFQFCLDEIDPITYIVFPWSSRPCKSRGVCIVNQIYSFLRLWRLRKYSNVPNKRACTFISGKVCLLTLIEPKRQILSKINAQGP